MIKIGRQTFYDWEKNDSDFVVKFENVKEGIIDRVEEVLVRIGCGYPVPGATEKGNVVALIAFLNARAKHRGYGSFGGRNDSKEKTPKEIAEKINEIRKNMNATITVPSEMQQGGQSDSNTND